MANLKSNTYELRELLYERQSKSRFSRIDIKNPINAIGTTISGVYSDLSQSFIEKSSGLTHGDINKAWRAKILIDRLGGPASGRVSGLPRDWSNTGKMYIPNAYDTKSSLNPVINGRLKEARRENLKLNGDTTNHGNLPKDFSNRVVNVSRSISDSRNLNIKARNHKRNEVIIFNLDGTDKGYQYIILQNRPPELEFQGETTWASIKSFGRNVPMYHFTGAEDKIQLQVSWFCNDPKRPWEVVQKCRLLESWSKANGYYSGPPVLQIDWGGSGLFSNALFILTSAKYILKSFRDGYMDRRVEKPEWSDGKLYPMAATQELIFNRVSGSNILHSSIYDPNKLEGLSGVGYSKDKEMVQVNENTLWQ